MSNKDEIEKVLLQIEAIPILEERVTSGFEPDEQTDILIVLFRSGTVSYRAYSPIPESLLYRLQELNKLWNEDPDALVRIAQNASSEPFRDLF